MKNYLSKNKRGTFIALGLSFLLLAFPSFMKAATPDDYGIVNQDVDLIESDTTWISTEIHEITKPVYVVNGATLTIEAGTQVKFVDSESNMNAGRGSLVVLDGTIKAIGTEHGKIKFTGETLSFNVEFQRYEAPHTPSLLRYVEIGDGRDEAPADDGGSIGFIKSLFIPKAIAAASGPGAIRYFGGRLAIENTVFANKYNTSIFIYGGNENEEQPGDYIHISNSNFEDLSTEPTIKSETSCPLEGLCVYRVKLQNNWYGKESGPDNQTFEGPNFGATYRTNSFIVDPVIIVPGILGSDQNSQGIWQIDPVLHYYDDQIKSLERNGYTKGVNLFVMPYDWHVTNVITAILLKQKIAEAMNISGVSHVDLVAHSMGGLVARQYIESTDYENNVDQLITLGTPHRGAPESYLTWEGGVCEFNLKCLILTKVLRNEATHSGYTELHKYVQEKVMTIGELLPDYSYLKNTSNGNLREYPENTPRNTFLENLNSLTNQNELSRIRFSNIVGDSEEDDTITSIRVGDLFLDASGKWEHGFPENFQDILGDQGLVTGTGDGTVPLTSSNYPTQIVATKTLRTGHTALPKVAQCDVLEILSAKANCTYIDEIDVINLLRVDIFSPVDVQVISPSGKKVGKNFSTGEIFNEIPGAFYSGYQTDVEYLTIPNPEDGEYKIVTQGVDGGGSYRVEASSIKEDLTSGKISESQKTFAGTAITGQVNEKSVAIEDAAIIDVTQPSDTTPPETALTLTGTVGENGWYKSAVSVSLSTEAGATTEYSLNNSNSWQAYTGVFTLSNEGIVTLQYRSADASGNKETTKSQQIKIDTISPEAVISFDITTDKLKVESKEANSSIMINDNIYIFKDQAGNTTKLTFAKIKDRKYRDGYVLQSIQYNQKPPVVLKDTKLNYFYKDNQRRENAKAFSAHLRANTLKLSAHYLKRKNQTFIMDTTETEDDDPETCEKRRVKKILPGLVIPYMETAQGNIVIKY